MIEHEIGYVLESLVSGKVIGEVYIQKLFNFNCVECNGWWSIVDPPELDLVYCPLCGRGHQVKIIKKRKKR